LATALISTRYVRAMAVSQAALDAIMMPSRSNVKPSALALEPNMLVTSRGRSGPRTEGPRSTIIALGQSSGDHEVSS